MNRTRIGMLTPSSNTVVEPMTASIVEALESVSAHFARFRVTEISLRDDALAQFELDTLLEAACLLADARMHAIAWNGTSAAWKGFEQDDALCAAISERFGVPATASMRAMNTVLEDTGATRIGLVTPYLDDVQAKIIANYEAAGYSIAAERHLGISENFAFSEIEPSRIGAMVAEVAASEPQAILIICTNLRAAQRVHALEREFGVPIYDSLSAVVWHALRLAGVDTSTVPGWGSLFTRGIGAR